MKNLTVMILLALAIAALVVAAVLLIRAVTTNPTPTTVPAGDVAYGQSCACLLRYLPQTS